MGRDNKERATQIKVARKKLRSTVDAIKGQFGFLNYEVEDGKKLFFHLSEVKENATLQPGDAVEFVLITNQPPATLSKLKCNAPTGWCCAYGPCRSTRTRRPSTSSVSRRAPMEREDSKIPRRALCSRTVPLRLLLLRRRPTAITMLRKKPETDYSNNNNNKLQKKQTKKKRRNQLKQKETKPANQTTQQKKIINEKKNKRNSHFKSTEAEVPL